MKKIPINSRNSKYQNLFALVDDEDYEVLKNMRWYLNTGKQDGPIYVKTRVNGKQILMHRFILNPSKGYHVDHKDFNGLNNQKINLRCCTQRNNNRSSNIRKNNTTGFKGVTFSKLRVVYHSQIMVDRKHIHCGTFDNKEDAARAYDEAAIKHFGDFACTNYSLGIL